MTDEIEKKQSDLTNLQISDIMGDIIVEGYLFRYSEDNLYDKDLTQEHWEKSTYLMQETFPVKGIPIMFGHSEEDEFTKVGIGIVNYAKEDEIGMFIKGQLHKREKWKKIVEEVNKRRKMGLSRKQVDDLADRAYDNMKNVVKSVPLQWSMGSYPPTYLADKKSGKIERAGIVEATLTPIPAEPKGTEAVFSFKSLLKSMELEEPRAKEDSEDVDIFFKQIIGNLNSRYTNKEIKMAEDQKLPFAEETQKAMDEFSEKMFKMIKSEFGKRFERPMEDEEEQEVKMMVEEEAKKSLTSDTLYKKSVDSDNLKSVVREILTEKQDEIIGTSLQNYLEKREQVELKTKKSISGVFDSFRKQAPDNEKTTNFETDENSRKRFGRVEIEDKPVSWADELRNVYNMKAAPMSVDESWYSRKAQNPYVGTLGGQLVGQEMATEILDPLRAEVVTFNAGVTETRVNNIGVYVRNKMTNTPTAYRPGINQNISDSEANYEAITGFLRPLACQVIVPRQQLMQTGTNMEEQLRREIIRSLRLQIDKEILEGVGNVTGSNTGAEIRGVKSVLSTSPYATTNLVTLATNGRVPKYEDLITAETQIHNENVELDGNTSGFIMHPRDLGTFRKMTDTTGQPLQYPNYSENSRRDLIGYQVHTTTQIDNAQTTGTSNNTSDIYFGNWRYVEYVIGNDIEIILDDMTLANNLQVRFIAYLYSDVIVHYPQAFYVMQGVKA